MKRWLIQVPLMWIVCSGCDDPERGLPPLYRDVPVPVSRLQTKASREKGHSLFLEHCALCHGERGDGRGQRREGFARSPRDFTNPAWRQSTSPRRVYHSIREGLPGSAMPAWKALDPLETWDLVGYVLSLAGEARS